MAQEFNQKGCGYEKGFCFCFREFFEGFFHQIENFAGVCVLD